MKICIFGAGAVGGVMAGWLHKAGHRTSGLARGATLTAIREHGLRIRTLATGEVAAYKVRAASNPQELGAQDCVIVTVKAQSLPEAARAMPALAGPDTTLVTAMNGVPWWFFDRLRFGEGKLRLESLDPEGALARAMPTGRIVGCVIHLAASTPEPGLGSPHM